MFNVLYIYIKQVVSFLHSNTQVNLSLQIARNCKCECLFGDLSNVSLCFLPSACLDNLSVTLNSNRWV